MELFAVAFGGCPEAEVRVAADATPAQRWLAAVALGGQGRYAAAATVLRGLLADPAVPRTVAAHAAVTLAAHRRQLGGHDAARRLDALGLRLADAALRATPAVTSHAPTSHAPTSHAPTSDSTGRDGTCAAAARMDALIGLAADAVGLGDGRGAHRLLEVAAPQVHPWWRLTVRLGWVRAELALLAGRPADAVGPAADALGRAERAGAVRHVLKSRLVLAVARGAVGLGGGAPVLPAADRDARALAPAGRDAAVGSVVSAAVAELDAVREEAGVRGLLPLCWPAALAAADLVGDHSVRPDGRRAAALTTVCVLMDYADPVGRRLMGESVWVPRVAVGSLAAPLGLLSPT